MRHSGDTCRRWEANPALRKALLRKMFRFTAWNHIFIKSIIEGGKFETDRTAIFTYFILASRRARWH
jgi:hypothetical protein